MKEYDIILISDRDMPEQGIEELSKWARNGWYVHSTWKQDHPNPHRLDVMVAFLLERVSKG